MKLLQLLLIWGFVYNVKANVLPADETGLEEMQRSLEMLKIKVDMMEKTKSPLTFEQKEKARNQSKPVFDARVDALPVHCPNVPLPSNCAKATACTETSGYYNITVSRYNNHTFQAFCDYRTKGGDWLHILQRIDGTENFARPWSDYVNGFGAVDGEYWIGLENLYALTNHDGPQELYVYMYNFNRSTRYARYDHFVIGNGEQKYALKSLGKYTGTAGDSLSYSVGASFSTHDQDSDTHEQNCAAIHKGGWWYKNCARTVPTGFYHQGKYNGKYANGIYWRDWLELWYSMKYFVMMIRRQRIFLD